MTQENKFVTEIIVNVVMLTRLDKNVNKIIFLNVTINNFLLDRKMSIFSIR